MQETYEDRKKIKVYKYLKKVQNVRDKMEQRKVQKDIKNKVRKNNKCWKLIDKKAEKYRMKTGGNKQNKIERKLNKKENRAERKIRKKRD
jgi:hypothetical protein